MSIVDKSHLTFGPSLKELQSAASVFPLPNSPDPSVPHAWIPLRAWAELSAALEHTERALESAANARDRYKAALLRISDLCNTEDQARQYIGCIARDAINPPIAAKPGQEKSL
jgi:hypothetical protein